MYRSQMWDASTQTRGKCSHDSVKALWILQEWACTVHRRGDLTLMKPEVSQPPSTSGSDITSSCWPISDRDNKSDQFTESGLLTELSSLNFAAWRRLCDQNQDKLYLVVAELFCFSGYWIMIQYNAFVLGPFHSWHSTEKNRITSTSPTCQTCLAAQQKCTSG